MIMKRAASDTGEIRKRGPMSFEDYLAHKKRCVENKVPVGHYFHNFNLEAHNANANQIEKIIAKREEDLYTPQQTKKSKQIRVKRVGGTPAPPTASSTFKRGELSMGSEDLGAPISDQFQ